MVPRSRFKRARCCRASAADVGQRKGHLAQPPYNRYFDSNRLSTKDKIPSCRFLSFRAKSRMERAGLATSTAAAARGSGERAGRRTSQISSAFCLAIVAAQTAGSPRDDNNLLQSAYRFATSPELNFSFRFSSQSPTSLPAPAEWHRTSR
jgi:hypothetical protein